MSSILGPHPEALLVGAFLIAVYQAAKFSELNLTDPVTLRAIGRFRELTVKDLAGAATYRAALLLFIGVSLLLYYLACQLSEPVVKGAIKLLTGTAPQMEGVPLPLYLAALFMGLTQPVIPGLRKLADAQRDFFHDQMHVPGRIIALSESLTTAINARHGANRRALMAEAKKLADDSWRQKLQPYGDLAFYNLQLEKAGFGSPSSAAETLRGASLLELRELISTLVLSNLIAVMRKSGPKQLGEVARKIDPGLALPPSQIGRLISSLILAGLLFGLAVTAIWHLLDLLRPVMDRWIPGAPLWPQSDFLGAELGRIVPSLFICLLISVAMMPKTLAEELGGAGAPAWPVTSTLLIEFGRAIASILIICFAVSLTIHFTAEFYQYGTAELIQSRDISVAKLLIIFVRTMPSLAIAYCALLYLFLRQYRPVSLLLLLLGMSGAVAALSFLVAITFLRLDFLVAFPDEGPGWDYAVFYVLANVLVSIAAFVTVVVFSRAQSAPAPQAVLAIGRKLRRKRLATP